MFLGLTRGELGLVVFIFGLVYGAGHLPRWGERLFVWMADRRPGSAKKRG